MEETRDPGLCRFRAGDDLTLRDARIPLEDRAPDSDTPRMSERIADQIVGLLAAAFVQV